MEIINIHEFIVFEERNSKKEGNLEKFQIERKVEREGNVEEEGKVVVTPNLFLDMRKYPGMKFQKTGFLTVILK